MFRGSHRHVGAGDLINAGVLCLVLFLFRIPFFYCVMLHDRVKAVGFFKMWSGYPVIQHHIPEKWHPWQHH